MLITCAGNPETQALAQTAQHLAVNLGPVFLSELNNPNSSTAHPIPSCPSGHTVRQCYQLMFNPSSPNNYTAQGFNIPAFQIAAGDAWTGTCDSAQTCGVVNSTWKTNLGTFLGDLKSYGITQIVPMLVNAGWGDSCYAGPAGYGCVTQTSISSACNSAQSLLFYRASPYGVNAQNQYPDCWDDNTGYYDSPQANGHYGKANPYFWGWAPLGNIIAAVVSKLPAGMSIMDLEVADLDLIDFTVQARFIYDNTSSLNVLSFLRSYAGAYASTLTFAAGDARNPDYAYVAGGASTCTSVYGGPATAQSLAALINAMTEKPFGFPSTWYPWYNPNSPNSLKWDWNFLCATGSGQDLVGGVTLPISLSGSMPTYLRFGAYPNTNCVPGTTGCSGEILVQPTTAQLQDVARRQFDEMYAVGQDAQQDVAIDMCETYPNQVGTTSEGFTMAEAAFTAYGWAYSNLSEPSYPAIFAVWEDALNSTYTMPNVLAPPYSCVPNGGGWTCY
jgi:hypothetical protein